jgi:hypothetical protein
MPRDSITQVHLTKEINTNNTRNSFRDFVLKYLRKDNNNKVSIELYRVV